MTELALYQARLIAADLLAYLRSKGGVRLQVHSVFQSSVNLLADDGELMTFATRDRDLMPMGLLVALDQIPVLGLKAGDEVRVGSGKTLSLPREAGVILLEGADVGSVSLEDLTGYGTVDDLPALGLIRDKLSESTTVGIASLLDRLSGFEEGSSFANAYCVYIYPALVHFLDCLEAGDYEGALRLAEGLIGFGPGLTPACDDFLAGIALDLYYRDQGQAFLSGLVSLARDRTSLISYHMLKKAADGKANTAWLALIQALAGGDLELLGPLIDRVLSYGASSGADFLLGLYCSRLKRPGSGDGGRKLSEEKAERLFMLRSGEK